ncbi:hypothetical protein AcW1_000669 [Taiwanofungus camphoratus]|nr:hypothetical protein AcW2_000830 [Antrodia cinnamomea]KAI0936422.1 hypothetical protein AcV5_004568 [Antrodia cinnamomea]KAI0961640.1 hypothetical protein AcV7_000688 [Antrodia cinnamomea]KAI0963651.1 hypothetical protein AcW1_000669 [Antrodia cinnamomea]
MIESLERAVSWCRVVGIPKLTVYDRRGILAESLEVRERLAERYRVIASGSDADSDIEFPPTPPPSDDSDSRPISPDFERIHPNLNVTVIRISECIDKAKKMSNIDKTGVRRRHSTRREGNGKPLILHIISRKSGKPAISKVATEFMWRQSRRSPCQCSRPIPYDEHKSFFEEDLKSILEGEAGLPSPDLMIIHPFSLPKCRNTALELYGFPPWQIRLTEFHYHEPAKWSWRKHLASNISCSYRLLEEVEFRQALDEFAAAEMRLGK